MPASANIKVLRVSASAEGYRREGFKFPQEDVDIPESILTSNQINRLMRDPMLKCQRVLVNAELPIVTEEELTGLREKAAIADAFLVKLPADYASEYCPSDYVTHLQNRVHELELELEQAKAASANSTHAAKQGARK